MQGSGGWTANWTWMEGFPPRPFGSAKPVLVSWEATSKWLAMVRAIASDELEAVQRLAEHWDRALAEVGGDPGREDWTRFRPLRLSREEDWSDWLAFLLQDPAGWFVASALFPVAVDAEEVEEAQREVALGGGDRRADLVLLWRGQRATHVEVKLWDQDFGKTGETAQLCEFHFSGVSEWKHYILVPETQREACASEVDEDRIEIRTWSEVSRELRRALLGPRSVQWRAFARAFCGAIEQRLIGCPVLSQQGVKVMSPSAIFTAGRILREANDGRPTAERS